jgi:hypothetical protein
MAKLISLSTGFTKCARYHPPSTREAMLLRPVDRLQGDAPEGRN